MHRQTLAALIGGREYTQQTPQLCCCASCRDLGFVGYELLRQIVKDVIPAVSSMDDGARKRLSAKLMRGIDEEERYRAGEWLSHLKEEDSTPQHCLGLMIAPFNDMNFKCECEHPWHDNAAVAPPQTMVQQLGPRAPRSDDWHDQCFVCFSNDDGDAEKRENIMCCSSCPLVAHKTCMATHGHGKDLPDSKESEWTCPTCVAKHDAVYHDTRCLKCERHEYIIDDLRAMCELASHDSKDESASARWGLACLDSVHRDLLAYHARLGRDTNQDMFQKSMFRTVEEHHEFVADLCDYWAKQGAKKSWVSTCEGMANKGVSCHGRMFTFGNPSQHIRDDHPEVPWDKYPDPPERGGPALCREYRRAWSDSSTQNSTDTAVTRRAESLEFFKVHPWIKKNIGGISDGASNYSSTSAAIYGLVDDLTTVQCISVEGMGKDNIDRDNGSEQQKLRAARASMDLTFTIEYIRACNARHHRGAINARIEPDASIHPTPEQKRQINAIDHISDMKLRASGEDGSLVLWELFSRRLSARAGRAVGYGRGRTISKSELTAKHGLALHKLPDVAMSFPEAEALPEGDDLRHNPAPCLSGSQKKDAVAASAALKQNKSEAREARKSSIQLRKEATFNQRTHVCEKCGLQFHRHKSLANHTANDCGVQKLRVQRRETHDAGTIKSLVQLNDDDLADEAQLAEENGLDLITATFTSSSFGWDIGDDQHQIPSEFRALHWESHASGSSVKIGDRIRVPARLFGEYAFAEFGAEWHGAFYYGWCHSKRANVVSIEYCASHSSQPGVRAMGA